MKAMMIAVVWLGLIAQIVPSMLHNQLSTLTHLWTHAHEHEASHVDHDSVESHSHDEAHSMGHQRMVTHSHQSPTNTPASVPAPKEGTPAAPHQHVVLSVISFLAVLPGVTDFELTQLASPRFLPASHYQGLVWPLEFQSELLRPPIT